ncbi:MAG: CarD family transcriptional regulator [Desulfovibrionaceae bacterium]
MFTNDDLVVYPAQGVGKIESIDKQTVGGVSYEFYIVRILTNNITLMVPVANASNVGLRCLITTEQAQTILDTLSADPSSGQIYTGQNWNRRYREYSEKLKSNDLSDVALVLRELMLIGRTKELSFGERRLLEQAMVLVVGEIAEVLQIPELQIREHIQSFLVVPAETLPVAEEIKK